MSSQDDKWLDDYRIENILDWKLTPIYNGGNTLIWLREELCSSSIICCSVSLCMLFSAVISWPSRSFFFFSAKIAPAWQSWQSWNTYSVRRNETSSYLQKARLAFLKERSCGFEKNWVIICSHTNGKKSQAKFPSHAFQLRLGVGADIKTAWLHTSFVLSSIGLSSTLKLCCNLLLQKISSFDSQVRGLQSRRIRSYRKTDDN